MSAANAAQGDSGLFLLALIALGLILTRVGMRMAAAAGVKTSPIDLPMIAPGRLPIILLIIVIILGALTRLAQLYDAPWYDEAFSLRMALMDTSPDIWINAWAHDVHPPGWYLLLGAWYRLVGTDLGALRLLPAILSLISIPLLYRVARLLGSSNAGALIAAGALAIAPGLTFYGVELRSYAVVMLLVLLALDGGLRGRQWAWVTIGALPLFHYMGFLYGAALIAFLWHRGQRPEPMTQSCMLSCVLIAMAAFVRQRTVGNVPGWMEFHPGLIFDLLIIPLGWLDARIDAHAWAVLIFSFVSAWLGVLMLRDRHWRPFALAALAIPLAIAAASLLVPLWVERVLLVAVLLLLIPAGDILARRPVLLLAMTCVIVAAGIFAVNTPYRINYRAAIASGCDGASRIYATSIHMAFTASINSHIPIVVWPGAQDNGQTFTVDEMPAFGFELANAPAAGDCIVYQHSNRTDASEAAFVSDLVGTRPAEARIVQADQIAIYVWRL